VLARIAHELYWLGRNLARAEFTARVVDGVFQVELQGQPDAEPGVVLGWNELLAMLGSGEEGERVQRLEALQRLTLDANTRNSMVSSVERAREGARTVRDVISADMWEAINTTALTLRGDDPSSWLAPAGPYLACKYIKERTALIGGLGDRTMLRDEAKSFLDAGCFIETADMVLRMLHVAFPPTADAIEGGGHALALLQAVGGFQAYRRAVPAPPNARPVARFLLFERAYPDSVAACVDSLHDALESADTSPRNSEPVLRLSRLAADLDFQRRTLADSAEIGATCEAVRDELVRVDADVADRYFAGAARHRGTTVV
jgi:uncharacterized alpha-E superfamily protein